MTWCFDDEVTPRSDGVFNRIGDEEVLVPTIWLFEVADVLSLAERRNRITRQQAIRFVQTLLALPIRVDPGLTIGEIVGLLEISADYQLTAYDASYLTLAVTTGLPLATGDNRLRAAAHSTGVPTLGA
jgi:predicted nucleic acid-binding protein